MEITAGERLQGRSMLGREKLKSEGAGSESLDKFEGKAVLVTTE